jgi:hypothetical protein
MTATERVLATLGGVIGGLLAFTIGMPVALHVEKVLQRRARIRIKIELPPRVDQERIKREIEAALREIKKRDGGPA